MTDQRLLKSEKHKKLNWQWVITLVFGFAAGFSVTHLQMGIYLSEEYQIKPKAQPNLPRTNAYSPAVGPVPYGTQKADLDTNRTPDVLEHFSSAWRDEDRSVADALEKKVRVLCWIMTQPRYHETRARHVKATWGRRCNKLLFMSSEADSKLPTIKLPVSEGRDFLWAKTKEAFRYVYRYHREDADWFMKADDDTYVVVENLRYLLSEHISTDPLYFGCRYKPYSAQGYMSGGAGYVLSGAALDRLVTRGFPFAYACNANTSGAEDAEIGICLNNIGVIALDSRDRLRRGRFFPFLLRSHLFPCQDHRFWYWKYLYYPADEGLDCCSDYAISYHYVTPKHMYLFEYFIYHFRPYGIRYGLSAEIRGSKATIPRPFGDRNSTKFANDTDYRLLTFY